MDPNIKLEKLRSYIGQLTDLKAGTLSELVLTRDNEAVDLLIEVLLSAVKEQEGFLKLDAEMSQMEAEEIQSPKDEPGFYDEENINPDLPERETNDIKEDLA